MPRRNEACQERDRLAAAGDSASKTPADSRLRAELPAFQFVPVIGLSGGFSTVRGSSRTRPSRTESAISGYQEADVDVGRRTGVLPHDYAGVRLREN
jgi:hypothetical protein